MTREEAINEWTFRSNHIKEWLDEYGEEPSIRHYVELIDMAIEALQEVQKHEETFEWCHDCKEYDTENYCCHRWSKVIRNTVEELKEEPPTIPCFTESAEAYKAWTGEEMGGTSERQKVAYICDKRRCNKEGCSNCGRTTDIEHAKNFELINNTYYERW